MKVRDVVRRIEDDGCDSNDGAEVTVSTVILTSPER